MKKKFAVAVTNLSSADQKKLLDFIVSRGAGWWHRIGDLWLLIDWSGSLTSKEIRDYLMPMSGPVGIVLEITESTDWSGFAPAKEVDQAFKWFHENWNRSD